MGRLVGPRGFVSFVTDLSERWGGILLTFFSERAGDVCGGGVVGEGDLCGGGIVGEAEVGEEEEGELLNVF